MWIKLIITFFFLASPILVQGQIDLNDHFKAIEYNNDAIKEIKNKNNTKAISYLIKAIQLDSTLRNAYITLNNACSDKDTILLKSYLYKAVEIFIEDDEILYYLGNLYRKESKIDSAIIAYTKAIDYSKINGEDYPLVYAYYLNRGICFINIESYVKAIQDFNYGIKLNPRKPALYVNKAILLHQLGNKNQACIQWEKASKLGSTDAKSYLLKYCQ